MMTSRYVTWLFFPALLLLFWQIGAWTVDPLLLPSPADTFRTLAEMGINGELWQEIAISLRRVLTGVLIGALVGAPFGILLGYSPLAERLLGSSLPSISATSSAIWAVFGLLWFGLSDNATIFVVAMTAIPLFAVNTRDGIRAVDADLVQLGQSMGFDAGAISRKVLFPSILPSFFAGGRLALGFGWRVGLVAEALGSPSGVGFRLKQAIDLMHTPEVFAWSVAVILIMILFEVTVLRPLEVWTFRWRKTAAA